MPILSDFSGILFDVDMTLTNSRREVSSELAEQLQLLGETSLKLGTCTGRSFVALKSTILQHFPEDSLHVTDGGSRVVTSQGEVIWEQLLPENTCRELHELGQKYGQLYYIPTLDVAYASQPFIEVYQGLHSLVPPLKPVSELTDFKASFMVFVNVSPEFQTLLEQRTDVTVKTSVSSNKFISFDVTPKGITKANGIEQWCAHHNLSPDQVIGVGDSDNDLEFLDMVGFAVGMGNSTEQVKTRVDHLIGHTDNNGLAKYLAEIMKGSQL